MLRKGVEVVMMTTKLGEINQIGSRLSTVELSGILQNKIFMLSCEMPKKDGYSLATQLVQSILNVNQYFMMINDCLEREDYESCEQVTKLIEHELRILTLLVQLAGETQAIDDDQSVEIMQKIAQFQLVLSFNYDQDDFDDLERHAV